MIKVKRDPRTIAATVGRSLKLQCPVCGSSSIVARPFSLKHGCDSCGAIFKREEGFFVGAIMANVVATEVFILLIYFALLLTTLSDRTTFIVLFAVAVAFPLIFYHHSWSLWLALDHLIEGLPRNKNQSVPPA